MTKWTSAGKCNLCGETFSKAGMSRHLTRCRQDNPLPLEGQGKQRQARLFHVVVEGRRRPVYWLHLAVPADASLLGLDQFLRDIWLECCGHLSAFTIGGVTYDAASQTSGWFHDTGDQDMTVTLAEALPPGTRFEYEYDFGTTTELTGRVVSEWEGLARGKTIQVMARNDPPPLCCVRCGKPAVWVCTTCVWSGSGELCQACSKRHKCGEDSLLPVVNSPRMGMCGYTG